MVEITCRPTSFRADTDLYIKPKYFPSQVQRFVLSAQYYGDLRAYLEKQGRPIGSLDMLIAAHALSTNCVLVTNNEKEFIRVPNLKIDNWVK